MLVINQLAFDYNDKPVLRDINLTLNAGEGLWIKGENGRGKTTLLKLMAGLLTPVRGAITSPRGLTTGSRVPCAEPLGPVDKPQDVALEALGQGPIYIGHQLALSPLLTTYETLALDPIRTCPDAAIFDILSALALLPDIFCRVLSSGQKKRLSLAKLLLSQAQLWLLDEPFVALDEQGITWLTQLIQQHLATGGSVVLTSHQPLPNLSFKEYTL